MATEGGPAGGDGGKKSGPPAPRKKSQRRQRSRQIKTPCTPDEFAAIVAKANDAGMSRAAWSRTLLLGEAGPRSQRRVPSDAQSLRQILGHLGRIGNNINQIAYHLNTGGPADLPELRLALKEYAGVRNAIYQALRLEPAPEPPPEPPPEKPGGAPRK
jgi:hypothetical protein